MALIHTDREAHNASSPASSIAEEINRARLNEHPDDVFKPQLLRFDRFGGGDIWIDPMQVVAVTGDRHR